MNKDPDTIFLQIDPEEDLESRGSEGTWCVDQINEEDIKYVKADIIETALDVLRIPKDIEGIEYTEPGKMFQHQLSLPARIRLLVDRWNYERKRKISDEKKARESQGEEITSMVRQSHRLSEEEKEGLYPSADESAAERTRYWKSKKAAARIGNSEVDSND